MDRIPPYAGMDRFVGAFDKLVVQPRRSRSRLPAVLLTEPGGGFAGRRIVTGLRARLRGDNVMLAPHACVPPAPDGHDAPHLELFEQITQQLTDSMPPGAGRLKLPGYRLLHAVLSAPRFEGPVERRHHALRDHCYADHRQWSPLSAALWRLGGGDQTSGAGFIELLWNFFSGPLFQQLPCALFGLRATRRILGHGRNRRWYAQWYRQQHGSPPTDFFRSALDLVPHDHDAPDAPDPEQVDRVLMHALLADLDAAARPRRFNPWRRRRTTRFVVLFEELGPADSRTQRFVRELRTASADLGTTSVFVVAAGVRSLAARVPDIEPSDLAHAGAELDLIVESGMRPERPSGMTVPAPAQDAPPDERAAYWLRHQPRLVPPAQRFSPGTEVVGTVGSLALALVVLAGLFAWRPLDRGERDACAGKTFLGTDGTCVGVAEGAKGFGSSKDDQGVRDALRMIEAQNSQLDAAARDKEAAGGGARPRTVVYLGPLSGGRGAQDPVRGGTLPELRGLALAQARINQLARASHDRVPLRVLTANAGDRFQDAEKVAQQIAQLARRDPAVVGVVGFGQSRPGTLDAIKVLNQAGLPMVGTSGTAAELLRTGRPYYFQLAPTNARLAQVMAAFTRQARTVADGSRTARRIELVADPTDVYSNDLAREFLKSAGRTPTTVWEHTPQDDTGGPRVANAVRGSLATSAPDLARQVCGAVVKEPRTALVWTARANEFTAFLDEMNRLSGECPRLTVLGGDDVTNSLLQGEPPRRRFPGLTLYYVAHGSAPELRRAAGRSAIEAQEFLQAYDRVNRRHQWGGAMRADGHPVLAWDALRYLSEAVDEARATLGGNEDRLGADQVQSVLYQGLGGGGFNGATGRVDASGAAGGGRFTPDKLVFVMSGDGRAKAVCGAMTKSVNAKTWGERFACPAA
ncbi:ABC transporter substrate-binding protein [Streptomyces sp. NPDC053474]|uniref:ABC transporter substrate-binding protein n=1 Tax=Streptomyces sp. NPDC053474 TaxID=3365704 RepID=UPI0037D1C0CB